MYQFQKKNGMIVDFEESKIINGVLKAGGLPEEAQKVADAIRIWLPTVVANNVVGYLDIRNKVLAELKAINPAVAAGFESFKKV